MPVSMVGRGAQLDELVAGWSGVVAGAPVGRCAVITGDAGVGKSTLVAAALDRLHPRPSGVLSGTARLHSPAPYDWLAAVLSGRDTGALPVPVDALAWLSQDPDAPRERYAPGALLRLAVTAVRALVGAGPVVLVVEDLHALDPASLNLVGELGAAPDLPVLLVVTSRPAASAVAPELTARTLARLSGAAGAIRQHLRPLGVAEITEVLGQVYPGRAVTDELVSAVWHRTGGNPYGLTELLATAGGADPQVLLGAPLPQQVGLAAGAPRAPGPGAELTAREAQVLSCLAAGMSNKQVARLLGISVRTVAVHVSNLLRKTGSASRTEAALWAVQRQAAAPL